MGKNKYIYSAKYICSTKKERIFNMTTIDFDRQFSIYNDAEEIRTLVGAIYHELSLRGKDVRPKSDIFFDRASREFVKALFLYVFETESPLDRSIKKVYDIFSNKKDINHIDMTFATVLNTSEARKQYLSVKKMVPEKVFKTVVAWSMFTIKSMSEL